MEKISGFLCTVHMSISFSQMPTKRCLYTGFRSRRLRVQSARMRSVLNPIDTDCLAFNYYRSKLHSQTNQLCYSILLTTSTSLAKIQLGLGQLRRSAALGWWVQPNSKSLLNQKLLKNSRPFVPSLGGKLRPKRTKGTNRQPY